MIRLATPDDVPKMHGLMMEFGRAAYGIETDLEAASAQLVSMIEDVDHGVIFLLEKDGAIEGLIGGIIVPRWFQPAVSSCIELFWWVNPAHRGMGTQLLEQLEAWAEARKASLILCTTGSLNPEGLRAFYEKRGYRLTEQSFERV